MKALYIVNPISGSGKGGRKHRVIETLKARGYDVVFTEYAGHAEVLARETDADVVVAVGGDGTVNEVARGLLACGGSKILGIVPCGSGDGLALHLGLTHDVDRCVDIVEAGRTADLDCASIDGRPFFSVSGVGLDAIVSERFAKAGSRGLMTYVIESARTWFGFKPEHYLIEVDGVPREMNAALITVANSNQWGNGAKICPLADSGDGLLDITVLKMFHTWEFPRLLYLLMTGRAHTSRRTICYRGSQINIHRAAPGPAHCDGDYFDAGEIVSIKVLPQRLKVLVP